MDLNLERPSLQQNTKGFFNEKLGKKEIENVIKMMEGRERKSEKEREKERERKKE